MTDIRKHIIDRIILLEGGYVNNLDDSGGETNFGISKQVARNNNYNGPMIEMPRSVAFDIYVTKYWDSMCATELSNLSKNVTKEIVDTAIHAGVQKSSEFLQRTLNVFNDGDRLYKDVVVDGKIGKNTLKALTSYLEFRDENVLIKALNCLQGSFYIRLAEKREKDESFVYGWVRARVEI